MAHAISVTDGTTTISFTAASGYQVEEYDLRLAENERGQRMPTIAETLQIYITGSSGAQVQTRLAALERLLLAVQNRALTGVGPRVYIQLQIDGEASAWRSELLDARIEPREQALRLWPGFATSFQFFILRESFWEGALTQLPLTNANGTNNTSGLTIWNHDDTGTGHDNYVQIAAANVAGTIPAPVMVELTNATGSAQLYDMIFMATNAFCDPANFPHVQEAETIVGVSPNYDSIGSNADSSNGQYIVKSVNGSNSQFFTLPAALLAKAAGHDFHLLARFRNWGDMYVRPSIYDSTGAYVLRRGDEREIKGVSTNALVDLGVLPLPPGGYASTYGAHQLQLYYRTAGTVSVQLDAFLLFPAAAFRRLNIVGSVANGAKITDDPIEDRAYITASGVDIPAVVRRSGPVQVWPNMLQRIYFAWGLQNTTSPIDQTFTVKAWYRPRRLSF